MNKLNLPVGISNFEEICSKGYGIILPSENGKDKCEDTNEKFPPVGSRFISSLNVDPDYISGESGRVCPQDGESDCVCEFSGYRTYRTVLYRGSTDSGTF